MSTTSNGGEHGKMRTKVDACTRVGVRAAVRAGMHAGVRAGRACQFMRMGERERECVQVRV